MCLFLFIIRNISNIAQFKIKNKMEENILVNFLFQKCIEKKVAANLSKYLCAFICSSLSTIVTSPSSKLWLWLNQLFSLFLCCIGVLFWLWKNIYWKGRLQEYFDIKDYDKILPIFKIKNDLEKNILVFKIDGSTINDW